jgi:hypothetical protein
MMTMTRLTLAMVVTLTVGTFVKAQAPTLLVNVSNEDARFPEVANAVRAKIGASSRFAVTGDSMKAELLVDLICVPMPFKGGVACSLEITMWPAKASPLAAHIANYLYTAPDASSAAEQIFEAFVSETSDEKLAAATDVLLRGVAAFCGRASSATQCKP